MGALLQSAVTAWRISLLALTLVAVALLRRKSRFVVIILAVLLGSTLMSMRQVSLEQSSINKFMGTQVEFTAQLVSDPSKTSTGNFSFTARLLSYKASEKEFKVRVPVRIISKSELNLLPGQIIASSSRVIATQEHRVAALLVMNEEPKVLTQPSRWAFALGGIREGLRSRSGEGDAGALIPGMVLGDTSKQSAEFKDAMKRSGLTHLVAVSGANFAIVSAFVLWCMQYLIRKPRLRIIATALALICFIALVRPSPSVLRAAAMAAVLLSAQFTKRGTDSLPALGFAIGAVVVGDPWQSRDAGFALSVLATAGLLLLGPIFVKKLELPRKVAGALAPPIAAMIFCSPVLVALSGYLSPMSIVANILVAPAVAPITVFGFIAALISPIAPWLSQLLINLIRPLAGFVVTVAHWISDFPVLTIHNGAKGAFIIICLGTIFWLTRKNWRRSVVITLILISTLAWLQRWPTSNWQIAQCDVGQGDSMVINLGGGKGIVIDVGPDAILENRCLRDLGISEIPLLVLSHFHADHVGGVSGLLDGRKVGQIWITNNVEPALQSARVFEFFNDTQLVTVQKGLKAKIGEIELEVIWPESTIRSFAELPGEGSQINNSSIAMIISHPDWSMFTAGDLEPPAQSQLIPYLRQVDIYKVSHHGSRYQDPAMMAVLSPQLGVISVGASNPYGHPSVETIASLTRLGAEVVRTDHDGAVSISANSHRLQLRKSKGGLRLFYWS